MAKKKKKQGHAHSVKAFLPRVTDWGEDINNESRIWHERTGTGEDADIESRLWEELAADEAAAVQSVQQYPSIEFLQSLLDRLTPEDVDAMSQRGCDPEEVRQVMYVKMFLMEFTKWDADDIRIFILT